MHACTYDNFSFKGWFNWVLLYRSIITATWDLGYGLSLWPTWTAEKQNKMQKENSKVEFLLSLYEVWDSIPIIHPGTYKGSSKYE